MTEMSLPGVSTFRTSATEADHLARDARVSTYGEYVRLRVPLILPGISTLPTALSLTGDTPETTITGLKQAAARSR